MRPPLPADARDVTGLEGLDVDRFGPFVEERPLADGLGSGTLADTLRHRRSARQYDPVDGTPVLAMLHRLTVPGGAWAAADGYQERFSPIPTAGGRQTHTFLLVNQGIRNLPTGAWMLRSGQRATLVRVELPADITVQLQGASRAALRSDVTPPGLLVSLARRRRLQSKYPDSDPHLWRDSGAALATAHLVAADLGMASCILGIADTVAIPLPGTAEHLIDTGAIAFGAERPTSHG